MDFQCRVVEFLGETSGTSKAGNPWKKKEWLVEPLNQGGQFIRKIKLQCFGERSDTLNLLPNKDYTVYVDLESREYNGRWYTEVSVYRADELNMQPGPAPYTQQGGMPQGGYASQPQNPYGGQQSLGGTDQFTASVEEGEDELPF